MNKKFFTILINSGIIEPITLTVTYVGNIYSQNAVYLTARNAATGGFLSNGASGINNMVYSGTYQVRRSFVKFDLSAVSGTIATAKLRIKVLDGGYPLGLTGAIMQLCTNSGTITTADFDSFGATDYGSNVTVDGNYFIIDFNASGLSKLNEKLAALQLVVRDINDYNSVVPTGENSAALAFEAPTLTLTIS